MLKAMFVYKFDSGVNFCGEIFLRELFSAGTFFPDRQKNPQKLESAIRKNLVPHGITREKKGNRRE